MKISNGWNYSGFVVLRSRHDPAENSNFLTELTSSIILVLVSLFIFGVEDDLPQARRDIFLLFSLATACRVNMEANKKYDEYYANL